MMAHVVDATDVAHLHLEEASDGDGISHASGPKQPRVRSPNSQSLRAVKMALHAPKRVKFVTAIVSVLSVIAVTVGVVVYFTTRKPTDTVVATIPVVPQTAEPTPFLKVSFASDGTAVFVLQKKHWNESFIVYPTVVKHSAPPHSGMERGSILLDSSDYVFHFEQSFDPRFLLLVMENHRTRLRSDTDELKKAFDDSQWPGYMTNVAIYQETDDEYLFATEPFLSHGFFVSSRLVTTYFQTIPGGSEFFPRNANLQVEYELDDGIVWVNYAIGLLPEMVMNQRVADDRVGYFMQRYTRYGVDNADPVNATAEGYQYMDTDITIINRRRLEVDSQTGKVKNPVTYYIDPSVPLRWRQSFADGVMAWAPAFEAIGLKDAIKAVLPGDKDWPDDYRIGDLRYNSISVMISDQTYAYGPIVVDPRSGEILHSDITFEYGFFNEVVADFDIRSPVGPPPARRRVEEATSRAHRRGDRQCGLSKNAHYQTDRLMVGMLLGTKMGAVPDSIIGRHFADIVMHEVGHTLGLRHNFAGSAQISRANLADKTFTSAHGLSTSIMDYVAVNIYSDLTNAAATTHDFYQSVIGDYDKAAIAYGYSAVDDETPGYRSAKLSALAQAAPLFLTDEDTDTWTNPYAQRFDISSDPIDYANDRLELVKSLRQKSLVDKVAEDAPWSNLWRYERALLRMVNASVEVVRPFIGGVNVTHAHRKAGETAYAPQYVPKAEQIRALNVLGRIISADAGLFPEPSAYGTYVQAQGYEGEDCVAPSNDYGCLARASVNLDSTILYIRQNAIVSALFPALDRIVAQDVNSPLAVADVLTSVYTAASTQPTVPRNSAVLGFFLDVLVYLRDNADEDLRLREAIATFINATVV